MEATRTETDKIIGRIWDMLDRLPDGTQPDHFIEYLGQMKALIESLPPQLRLYECDCGDPEYCDYCYAGVVIEE